MCLCVCVSVFLYLCPYLCVFVCLCVCVCASLSRCPAWLCRRKETASGKQQAKTLAGLLKQDFPPFLNDPATPRRERQTRKHTHQKFFKDFKDRAAAFQQVVETAATREKEYAQAARRASSVDHDSSDEEAPLAGCVKLEAPRARARACVCGVGFV